jgi:hypothetical protein
MAVHQAYVARLGKQVRLGGNARKVLTARADAHAAKIAPTIKKLRASGATTLRAIAAQLNARGIRRPAAKGGATQVWRVLARLLA